jgi:hypothetical protein
MFGAFVVIWVGGIFLTIAQSHPGPNSGPPTVMFILFPLIWLGWMGFWVLMLVVAIVYGVKAGRGEWAGYPLLGRLARRILKMGPGGIAITP